MRKTIMPIYFFQDNVAILIHLCKSLLVGYAVWPR